VRIPLAALELIEESSVLKSSKDRLYLAQLMGSVVHHAERLLGEATFDFRLAQHETNTQDVDFPTSQEAHLLIRVPKRDCYFVISVKLPRPLLSMEQ